MQQIRAAVEPDNIVFILDATQGQAVHEQATAFHEAVDIGSVVITKLDGHAKGGGALSAVAATGAPIVFLGLGEHFDDFEPFNPGSFVSRLLGLGDMRGLVEQIKDTVGKEKEEEMMDKFTKGVFTLRDMCAAAAARSSAPRPALPRARALRVCVRRRRPPRESERARSLAPSRFRYEQFQNARARRAQQGDGDDPRHPVGVGDEAEPPSLPSGDGDDPRHPELAHPERRRPGRRQPPQALHVHDGLDARTTSSTARST